ncbi:hypothetical protein NC651_025265 [Populus alba x Populus x berolinensis]|nr:hypothetical protein NC651_025265 [Populus alba x Populus x berolinensis]
MRDQAQTTRQLQLLHPAYTCTPGPIISLKVSRHGSVLTLRKQRTRDRLDDQVLFGGRARKNTQVLQVSRARRACLAKTRRTQQTYSS